tara:strand:+ start:452 stop:937 length:486 start_codon:yes stop_codon:yes gene_type:complete
MSNKKRIVVTDLGNIFSLPKFFSITERERELASVQFMLYYNHTNFVDRAIPSLAALMSLGKMKIILIDGWEDPLFFKARMAIATLTRVMLPEKTVEALIKNNLTYYKASTDVDMENKFIEVQQDGNEEGFEVIDLRETSWTDYVKVEFPELYQEDPEKILN